MGQVAGKVAIITGGARGIGAVAGEGAKVVVTDVDDRGGEALVQDIRNAGGEATYLHLDVTCEARWPHVIAAVEQRFGHVDVMVANAGIAIMTPIVAMTFADWRRQQAVNLDGVFLSVKFALPAMRRSGGGSIILMSSVAGLRGSPGLAGYSATKGGVRLFAKSVAMECAQAGDNIRVNSVHPGIIETEIWENTVEGADDVRPNAPIDPQEIARAIVPVGRTGHPRGVASGVLFLACDASGYMTGFELVIDGGITGGGSRRR